MCNLPLSGHSCFPAQGVCWGGPTRLGTGQPFAPGPAPLAPPQATRPSRCSAGVREWHPGLLRALLVPGARRIRPPGRRGVLQMHPRYSKKCRIWPNRAPHPPYRRPGPPGTMHALCRSLRALLMPGARRLRLQGRRGVLQMGPRYSKKCRIWLNLLVEFAGGISCLPQLGRYLLRH